MSELLLEIFSEEIPARMQSRAAGELMRLLGEELTRANLAHQGIRAFVTPRRLALLVEGLPATQPDLEEEKKGPRDSAPDAALAGSLKPLGMDVPDLAAIRALAADGPALEVETEQGRLSIRLVGEKKGASFLYTRKVKGRPTAEVLPGLIETAIRALSWPKSMRFSTQVFRWVRPLRSIIALFDGKVLAGSLDLGGGVVKAFGAETAGHRFLAPEPFTVSSFAEYEAKLEKAFVILDQVKRRASIEAQLAAKAKAEGFTVKPDAYLLDEVVGLVEYPVVLIGRIDEAFMDVPAEVLTTSMRSHQKYFALETADGKLAPRFAVVANMATSDGGKAIIGGNERVLRARLSDARFFWDQDRKVKLDDRLSKLEEVIFHAKLGSVARRVERLAGLSEALAEYVPNCPANEARRAARLAKADLSSGMVGEFPELQGIMGRYYALGQGEAAAVADAIAQHYSPVGPGDACPTAPVSVAVALAEKLDTLVGFWLIDEKPTGSKDPYALRRAALGVIRLVLENGLRVRLGQLFGLAAGLYGEQGTLSVGVNETLVASRELLDFFADRLKVHLREDGVRHDLIGAVFAMEGEDDLVRLVARVKALQAFLGSEDGANLLTAYRRAANILRIEEKKDDAVYAPLVSASGLQADQETALLVELAAAEVGVKFAIAKEDFEGAMRALAELRRPVDVFFEEVTVNAEDAPLRRSRLGLLARIRSVMEQVAAFRAIEG